MKFVRVLLTFLLAGATAASFSVPSASAADEYCVASWYGPGFHGRTMANGRTFNQNDASVVAHKSLPFGTRLRVFNLENGLSVDVVVQDRGPYINGRCVDLSRAAAVILEMIGPGTAPVRVVQI